MANLITLPAPASAALLITVKPCGGFSGLQWGDGHGLSLGEQAEIEAATKAQMFKGGKLCLASLVALKALLQAVHNTACSMFSAYQEKHGFEDTAASQAHDVAIGEACAMELRARAWLAAYPVTTGEELARVLVGLIGSHSAPMDLNHDELKAVRSMARGILAAQ